MNICRPRERKTKPVLLRGGRGAKRALGQRLHRAASCTGFSQLRLRHVGHDSARRVSRLHRGTRAISNIKPDSGSKTNQPPIEAQTWGSPLFHCRGPTAGMAVGPWQAHLPEGEGRGPVATLRLAMCLFLPRTNVCSTCLPSFPLPRPPFPLAILTQPPPLLGPPGACHN